VPRVATRGLGVYLVNRIDLWFSYPVTRARIGRPTPAPSTQENRAASTAFVHMTEYELSIEHEGARPSLPTRRPDPALSGPAPWNPARSRVVQRVSSPPDPVPLGPARPFPALPHPLLGVESVRFSSGRGKRQPNCIAALLPARRVMNGADMRLNSSAPPCWWWWE
jgi:hypothetical protein